MSTSFASHLLPSLCPGSSLLEGYGARDGEDE